MLKGIPAYSGYVVSTCGKVFTEKQRCGQLKTAIDRGGYEKVTLRANGKNKNVYVHHLVLFAFVGPCPKGKEACHINGNKLCNHIYNLRWDTHSANIKDSVKHGIHKGYLQGEANISNKLAEFDVRMIIYMFTTGLFTQTKLAEYYNVDCSTIHLIVRKKKWRYLWLQKRSQLRQLQQ